MKKLIHGLIAVFLALAIILVNAPGSAKAIPIPIEQEKKGIADGNWQWADSSVSGKEVNVDLAAAPAPAWLQLLTKGLKIEIPAKICHPFSGGQYSWVGEIRRLVNDQWVKLDTVNAWVPDKEGQFTSCAVAPAAGTYALFGYYTGPAVPKYACSYSTDLWIAGMGDYDGDESFDLSFWARLPNLPAGTLVTYQVLEMVPEGAITGAMSGTGTLYPADHMWAGIVDFLDYNIFMQSPVQTLTIRISALGCTKDILASNPT